MSRLRHAAVRRFRVADGDNAANTAQPPLGRVEFGRGDDTRQIAWTPSSAAYDRAGNPVSGAVRSETGAADSDF